LVEEFRQKYIVSEVFRDMDVLFIQHHLGPFIPKIRIMTDCGLETSNCWFVDIPYSTNDEVRRELLKIGCPSNQMVEPFNDPIEPYSRRQIERVEYILSNLSKNGNSKILVIDDGAYFARTLNYLLPRNKEMVLRFKERGTYLVEQTTRGHLYLESEEGRRMLNLLNIPAVSIARAKTKSNLESPFIGAAVSQRMMTALQKDRHLSDLGRVFVLGFGAVGKATTCELAKLNLDAPIDVYDVQWRTLEKDIKQIGANALKEFPKEGAYNVVLGCTGKAAVTNSKQLKILDANAALVSGSSAAVEFNREKFVDHAYRCENDEFFVIAPEETRRGGLHASIRLHAVDREFSFLNAGFPVNFDGSVECLPTLLIQPTHGMLLAAAYEALSRSPGFNRLSDKYDTWFFENGLKWIGYYGDETKATL
jgi:hypothetical protein